MTEKNNLKIVYIDSQNIHKGIQELGWIIDWGGFYKYMKRKFNVDKVKIFLGYLKKYEKFYLKKENLGKIIFKGCH